MRFFQEHTTVYDWVSAYKKMKHHNHAIEIYQHQYVIKFIIINIYIWNETYHQLFETKRTQYHDVTSFCCHGAV